MDLPVYRRWAHYAFTAAETVEMINQLFEVKVQCPYCWENFQLLIDASIETQEYIEDCEVCCRPIDFIVDVDESDQVTVQARLQDE